MGLPADGLKALFKEVITDPYGLNLPTLPTSAKVVGIAKGNEGNRTGVYGYSERSTAVYGESPVFAGFFQGDVYVNGTFESRDAHVDGNLSVTGNLQGPAIDQLRQGINDLTQKIASLETSGVTRMGIPVEVPVARPYIEVTELNRHGGFLVKGNGFKSLGQVFFNIVNITKHQQIAAYQNEPPSPVTVATHAKGDGTLGFNGFGERLIAMDVDPGSTLTFTATDGRSDANDMTGILWSNTATAASS